jgi:flagellar basal-body rod protein FlgC
MANDGADFARSMGIATSGLRAQAGRMRVISENIANADSTASNAGGDPYRRKVPTFSSELDRTLDAKVVALGRIRPDPSASSSTIPAILRPTRQATSNTPTSIRWSK